MKNKKSEKTLNILLVEDSTSDAALLQENILVSSEKQMSVVTANSLRDAVGCLQGDNNIDVVLLDLTLPDSAGVETVLRVKLLRPDLPVVVLTGVDDEKTGVEAVRIGVQDYLVKGRVDGRTIARAIRYAIERKKTEQELRRARDELELRVEERTEQLSRQASLLDLAHDAIFVCDLENRIIFWNKGAVRTYGWTEQEAIGNKAHVLLKTVFDKPFDEIKAGLIGADQWEGELTQTRRDGSQIVVFSRWALQRDKNYNPAGILEINYDITERKRAEIRTRITNVLLELFAQKTTRKEYLDSVVNAIRDWSGCRCVGIRLTDSEGFIPYESCVGFSERFLSAENMLSLKTDKCLCIRAITQSHEFPDSVLTTPKGSFRSDNIVEFLKKLPDKQESCYRGNCMQQGFASLAVIPVRYREQILGAIHLADETPCKVSPETVEFLENMAMLIGEAVHRFDMESKLRESEERYRRLVEISPDGIGVERDGVVVFINTAGAKLLGAGAPDDLIGRPILDFVHPDFRERTRRLLEYLRKKARALPLREGRLVRTDGSSVEVEMAATPFFYQDKPSTQIVFRDITERKRQEQALQLSRHRLAEAQRVAHLGNWEWDIASGKLWWSDETYRIFGVEPGRFTPSYEAFLEHVHPHDRRHVKQSVEDAIYKHKQYALDHRIVRGDGVERVVHEMGEVAYDRECRPVKMFGIVQDVTEHKRIENELRSSHHQLRLLTAQLSLVEEKERRRIASDLHDSVGQILAFASRELRTLKKLSPDHLIASMTELCNQLDQAILQTRSLSFDLSPSILYDLGLEVAIEDLAEKFCNERKIQCRFESIPGPKPPLAEDVKILLYRAVRELFINVAKHAKASSIRVSLAKSGNEMRITVEDDGQGFDAKAMEDGLAKPGGFGIFSVRERLGHVGGRLEIESAKGKGTKITLVAPLGAEHKT